GPPPPRRAASVRAAPGRPGTAPDPRRKPLPVEPGSAPGRVGQLAHRLARRHRHLAGDQRRQRPPGPLLAGLGDPAVGRGAAGPDCHRRAAPSTAAPPRPLPALSLSPCPPYPPLAAAASSVWSRAPSCWPDA